LLFTMTPVKGIRTVVSLRDGRAYIIPLAEGHQKVQGLGVIDVDALGPIEPGKVVELCGEPFVVLQSGGLTGALSSVERRAQIITLKDIGPIVARLGVAPDSRVVEIGGGSGYLTIALAHFVGENGKVVTYDREPKAIELVRRNLHRAGYESRVELVEKDPKDITGGADIDALVADVPDPWELLKFAESSLKPGAWAVFYTPSMNQVESVVRALRKRGWHGTYTLETLERQMVVGEHGVRPSFEMLGHTGYLTFSRWLGNEAAERASSN